jgi:putative NADPH-quinone reductase
MKVFIVYCHPSKNSFTYEVKEAFIKGLESAGHSYEISDLIVKDRDFEERDIIALEIKKPVSNIKRFGTGFFSVKNVRVHKNSCFREHFLPPNLL